MDKLKGVVNFNKEIPYVELKRRKRNFKFKNKQ